MDMRKLEEMKGKLMHELEIVAGKPQFALADITIIDTLAHALKNLDKVMEAEGGHSQGSYGNSGAHYVRGHYSRDGGSYNSGAYGSGGSYGSYDSYDSGRSYRDALETVYSNATDPREKEVLRKMMDRM